MKYEFQVGDLVRIREDIPYRSYSVNGVFCNDDMWNHRGQTATIKEIRGGHDSAFLKDPGTPFSGEWVWDLATLEPADISIPVDVSSLL